MGADLIGYLVKGRKLLFDQEKKAAVLLAQAVIDQAKVLFAAVESTEKPPGDFEDFLSSFWEEEDAAGLEHYAQLNAAMFVSEFCEFWQNPDERDVASRPDPGDPKEQLLFAGAPSWGDEPEGVGYKLLREAFRLNVAAALGIR